MPICIAWSHVEAGGAEAKAHVVSLVRRVIEVLPRAVNFPLRCYGKGQFGDRQVPPSIQTAERLLPNNGHGSDCCQIMAMRRDCCCC